MQQINLNIFDYKMIFVGIFLFMHGFVYFNLSRGLFSNADNQLGISVLIGKFINKNTLDLLIKALWLLAGLGFIIIGIMIAFNRQPGELTSLILIAISIVGIISFTLYWDGIINNLITAGLIGAIIDFIIIVVVLIS